LLLLMFSTGDEILLLLMFSTCDEILLLWRAWLHPWTQPVHVGWCTAPRGVHHATCTVNNLPVYIALQYRP
jgi:hypothetical protein